MEFRKKMDSAVEKSYHEELKEELQIDISAEIEQVTNAKVRWAVADAIARATVFSAII